MPGPSSRPIEADTPVQFLRGVGPVRAAQLRRLGVERALDLLHHYPVDYVEVAGLQPIGRLRPGIHAAARGTLLDISERPMKGSRSRKMLSAVLGDESGRLQLVWFNAPWLSDKLRVGEELLVSGKVDAFRGRPQMVNPAVEDSDQAERHASAGPLPRYPLTAGLQAAALRKVLLLVVEALADLESEPLRESFLQEWSLMGRGEALRALHLPASLEEVSRARERLAFDEALALQLAVGIRRRHLLRRPATVRLGGYGEGSTKYVAGLGFAPTGAQRRALAAIAEDLRQENAMHRLLQGDVGAGKTLVAIIAMIWIAEAGAQAAFMAPTEVLARQHGEREAARLEALGLRSAILTAATPPAEKREILRDLAAGELDILFGTHALISAGVKFQRLGLAVVDEQHRFGVLQRAALGQQGAHILVMSATPIPRSLALTVYGDLDLSILDEKPAGRLGIETRILGSGQTVQAIQAVKQAVASGGQAFLVYPLVEESEASDRASAEGAYEELSSGELSGIRLGLLHGRMKAREKGRIAAAFSAGELDALVATTVIEVGVDVPAATLMVIHEADRFGLAQLHQLRGRVGRGKEGGTCLLVASEGMGEAGQKRLQLLASTEDGFRLAEEDLRTRGMGDLHGIRQHGELPFRLLNPLRDEALVLRAREHATKVLEADPHLKAPANRELRVWLEAMGERSPMWSAAG